MKTKCHIHKKYKGKRQPKSKCVYCLMVYYDRLKYAKAPKPKATVVVPDKKKYSRKGKNKSQE